MGKWSVERRWGEATAGEVGGKLWLVSKINFKKFNLKKCLVPKH